VGWAVVRGARLGRVGVAVRWGRASGGWGSWGVRMMTPIASSMWSVSRAHHLAIGHFGARSGCRWEVATSCRSTKALTPRSDPPNVSWKRCLPRHSPWSRPVPRAPVAGALEPHVRARRV